MKTLIAWMIANVEMLTTVLLIAFFEYFLFHTPAGLWGDDRMGHAILGPLLVVLVKGMAGGYPSRSTLADLVNLVLLSTAFRPRLYLCTSQRIPTHRNHLRYMRVDLGRGGCHLHLSQYE